MDDKLTEQIQQYLIIENKTDEDIIKGATLLLKLNRNRFYFQRAVASPRYFESNIAYELKKYLRIRLDRKTMADINRMTADVMPKAKAIIDAGITVKKKALLELPVPDGSGDMLKKGKRKDHDRLPAEIAGLWEKNAERYKKIKQTYETLKTMLNAEPCDRYETCSNLVELDKKYRADMQLYDSYIITDTDDVTQDGISVTDEETGNEDVPQDGTPVTEEVPNGDESEPDTVDEEEDEGK